MTTNEWLIPWTPPTTPFSKMLRNKHTATFALELGQPTCRLRD